MDRVVFIIDEMVVVGVYLNECSYIIFIEGYVCIGDMGLVFKYFNCIKEVGLKLDVIVYVFFLKVCCKVGCM